MHKKHLTGHEMYARINRTRKNRVYQEEFRSHHTTRVRMVHSKTRMARALFWCVRNSYAFFYGGYRHSNCKCERNPDQ